MPFLDLCVSWPIHEYFVQKELVEGALKTTFWLAYAFFAKAASEGSDTTCTSAQFHQSIHGGCRTLVKTA